MKYVITVDITLWNFFFDLTSSVVIKKNCEHEQSILKEQLFSRDGAALKAGVSYHIVDTSMTDGSPHAVVTVYRGYIVFPFWRAESVV